MFWSMIFHFHHSGYSCLPPFAEPDKEQCYRTMTEEVTRCCNEASAAARSASGPRNLTMGSKLRSVVSVMNSFMGNSSSSDVLPDHTVVPHRASSFPKYWEKLNALWTESLKRYLHGQEKKAPCLWFCKQAGCRLLQLGCPCPLDHDVFPEQLREIDAFFRKATKAELSAMKNEEEEGPNRSVVSPATGQIALCSACGQRFELSAALRCDVCSNTVYCKASCLHSDSSSHRPYCRGRGADVSTTDRTWAVFLPADDRMRPYATLLPVAGSPVNTALAQLIGPGPIVAEPPMRTEQGRDNGVMLLFARNASTDSRPVNLRASAILTPIQLGDPLPNAVHTKGPSVKVRGDALLVRFPPGPLSSSTRALDFSYDDFDKRWGLLSILQVGNQTGVTLLPRTPDGEATLVRLMSRLPR